MTFHLLFIEKGADLSKKKSDSQRHPPKAKVLKESAPGRDPWKELRNRPGIKIIGTARREPG